MRYEMALTQFEGYRESGYSQYEIPCVQALDRAIDALIKATEQDNQKPLTLEELKERDTAVWLKCGHWAGWAFPYFNDDEDRFYFTCNGHDQISRAAEDYMTETKWNYAAYDHKPKEA